MTAHASLHAARVAQFASVRRVLLTGWVVLGLLFGMAVPLAHADGGGIVSAAQAMQSAGYPYCFDGGNIKGPTVGITDPTSDGSYSNCSQIGRVGFDCTGLTLYAVYQGTGNASLSHDGYQASSGGGQVIGSESELQPGDIVYFDYKVANGLNYIDHAGIYVGGGDVLSAVSEKYGIRTESIAWYEAGGLHFVGAKRYWTGGGVAEGSFVGHDGFVYRIAGGAPIYVSSWNAVGGSQPTTSLSDAEYAALPQYPRDGTILDGSGGRVFVSAGGAPLYVSSWSAIGGSRPGIRVDEAAIDNAGAGAPWDHLRQYPADGTLLGASGGGVFVVAGGAPLYVSNWAAIGGSQPVVHMDEWDIDNTANPAAHLRQYPADGTFLTTSTGNVYRVAGGAPFYTSTWSIFGGPQPSVKIDGWDIQNLNNPLAHLSSFPLDGTVVEGLPSGAFWTFGNGYRHSAGITPGAVTVDDVGLGNYPLEPTAVGASSGPTGNAKGGTSAASHGSLPFHDEQVCSVPDLKRMTLYRAKRMLASRHCKLGKVKHAGRSRHPRIIRQATRPRTIHRPGYAINVTVD